ncbi:hypothetical protein ABS71_05020 [bacterium SCN 62-11]|nr:NUDIX hydrolase [Candidatus Eremiobacteraeota bacterium]ODT74959.1 MAG: hypothetical protein ABS71_05020 [bacterium SCN 62-11]
MILRVCGALLRENRILLVRHREGERIYWTLPGGGLEAGETPEEGAVREMLEETGLTCSVERQLFDEPYRDGFCRCFLMRQESQVEAVVGFDPEEAHLPEERRMLVGLEWLELEKMRQDQQVSQVLQHLG